MFLYVALVEFADKVFWWVKDKDHVVSKEYMYMSRKKQLDRGCL